MIGKQLHGPAICPRPCSECGPKAKHHWIECSINDEDEEFVADFKEEYPDFDLEKAPEYFLLAHFACKHCEALREYR